MEHCKRLIACLSILAFAAGANAAEFNYSYLEVFGDLSKTKNTAPAPVEDDADGDLIGVAGSWELFDAFYVKGAWSREDKDFANEVVRTPVDLDSRQTVSMLGAGYHLDVGERTSFYAELLVILDFEVKHSIPLVVPSDFGPPTVTTVESVIDGDGLAGAVGVRCWITDRVELEGQLSRIHTFGDVSRTGAEISDTESLFRIGGRFHAGGGLSFGGHLSYSKHTDDNFNNIRKLGVSLRYDF